MKITTKQEVEITPTILAEAFTEMDNEDQAEFLTILTEMWKDKNWDTQAYYIMKYVDDEVLKFISTLMINKKEEE